MSPYVGRFSTCSKQSLVVQMLTKVDSVLWASQQAFPADRGAVPRSGAVLLSEDSAHFGPEASVLSLSGQ